MIYQPASHQQPANQQHSSDTNDAPASQPTTELAPQPQPRRRKHRRLRKRQRATLRQANRVDFRCLRKAKRQLSKRGLTQDVTVQVQPGTFSNGRCSLQDEQQHLSTESGRQAEAEAATALSTELTIVMTENLQL